MLDHLFFDLDFETYKDALFEDQNYTSEQMKRTNSVSLRDPLYVICLKYCLLLQVRRRNQNE